MWYLAELLFAETLHTDGADYQCESSNVVFDATDAAEAYRKAVAWGLAYAADPPATIRLLGVANLTTVGETLGDGTEICGKFFRASAVWELSSELIPPPGQLKAIMWEQGRDVSLDELLCAEQAAQLRRACGQHTKPDATPDSPC